MEKLTAETEAIMQERFGKDNVIALATTDGFNPSVRYVDAYYEDRCFYKVTYSLSNKMKQLARNPHVAVCGEWFTAKWIGLDLGSWGAEENGAMREKLKVTFRQWLYNGDTDLGDINTHILCIQLTDGVLMSHGTRYDIDFSN